MQLNTVSRNQCMYFAANQQIPKHSIESHLMKTFIVIEARYCYSRYSRTVVSSVDAVYEQERIEYSVLPNCAAVAISVNCLQSGRIYGIRTDEFA
jgi:hypothetical protein